MTHTVLRNLIQEGWHRVADPMDLAYTSEAMRREDRKRVGGVLGYSQNSLQISTVDLIEDQVREEVPRGTVRNS